MTLKRISPFFFISTTFPLLLSTPLSVLTPSKFPRFPSLPFPLVPSPSQRYNPSGFFFSSPLFNPTPKHQPYPIHEKPKTSTNQSRLPSNQAIHTHARKGGPSPEIITLSPLGGVHTNSLLLSLQIPPMPLVESRNPNFSLLLGFPSTRVPSALWRMGGNPEAKQKEAALAFQREPKKESRTSKMVGGFFIQISATKQDACCVVPWLTGRPRWLMYMSHTAKSFWRRYEKDMCTKINDENLPRPYHTALEVWWDV